MSRTMKSWGWSAGEWGRRVRVYEPAEGHIRGEVRDPSRDKIGADGKVVPGYRSISLGHRDREAAKRWAKDQAEKLAVGLAPAVETPPTLARLFAAYKTHRTPRKSRGEQAEDGRRAEMWARVLGAKTDVRRLTLGQWEAFEVARTSGAIDGHGQPIAAEAKRQPMRPGTVAADQKWLSQVLGWASRWREASTGRYLLDSNPVRGLPVAHDKNPRRPVTSTDRYEKLLAKAPAVHAFLPTLLTLAHGTGRRIGAVLALRYEDLRLEKSKDAPHGAIRWPAATDKQAKEWWAPISAPVRAALEHHLKLHPGIGAGYLFPSPKMAGKHVSKELASHWLLRAEQLAKVPKQDGSLWHAFRRGWATARKHLPDADVAAAGGWANAISLKRCYQQVDAETLLRVVCEPAELREAQG